MLVYIELPGRICSVPMESPGLSKITRVLHFDFPTGRGPGRVYPRKLEAQRELRHGPGATNLMLALGVNPNRVRLSWRASWIGAAALPADRLPEFDQYYLSLTPSFRARHASLQEIEELLLVRGITPDLFYGSYTQDAEGRLIPHGGLRDCLSVYGSIGGFGCEYRDAGGDGGEWAWLRKPPRPSWLCGGSHPSEILAQLAPFNNGGKGMGRLTLTSGSIVTLRATAQLRLPNGQLSDLHRTVSAMVKLLGPER